jgi:hypothetical protein
VLQCSFIGFDGFFIFTSEHITPELIHRIVQFFDYYSNWFVAFEEHNPIIKLSKE